jgi:hypothetical protein
MRQMTAAWNPKPECEFLRPGDGREPLFRRLLRRPATTPKPPVDEAARARLIDTLMAGPVRERPAITVVGDDEVFGVSPIRSNA